MPQTATARDLDLIEELWLRRWARQHYTDPERRVPSWHPIIHDEMRKKDGELFESGRLATSAYSPFLT